MPNHFLDEKRALGTREAVRRVVHRRLGFVAYIILAIAVTYAVNGVRQEGIRHRQDLATAGAQAVRTSCHQVNTIRGTLRVILKEQVSQSKEFIRKNPQSAPEIRHNAILLRKDIRRLHSANCTRQAAKVAAQGR